MSIINSYGFNDHFANASASYPHANLFPGRVICMRGQQFHIITNDGEIEAELVGNLLNTREEWELPKVGDWVVYSSYDDRGYITGVIERRSELSRKKPYRSYPKLSKEHQRYLAAVRDQRRQDKQHGKIARQMQILKRKSQS